MSGRKRHYISEVRLSFMETGLEILNASGMADIVGKSRNIVLTDDYAPVENLLAPVVVSAFRDWYRTTSSDHDPPSWLDTYRRQRD